MKETDRLKEQIAFVDAKIIAATDPRKAKKGRELRAYLVQLLELELILEASK